MNLLPQRVNDVAAVIKRDKRGEHITQTQILCKEDPQNAHPSAKRHQYFSGFNRNVSENGDTIVMLTGNINVISSPLGFRSFSILCAHGGLTLASNAQKKLREWSHIMQIYISKSLYVVYRTRNRD